MISSPSSPLTWLLSHPAHLLLILGGGRLTQLLPGSCHPQGPSRLTVGTHRGNLPGRVARKSCLWPPETRQVCKSHTCSCWHFMPSDATVTSKHHQCCAAVMLPLCCAARSPEPCLAPLPFSPCSFLSLLLFSTFTPLSFFFLALLHFLLRKGGKAWPLKCPFPR